MLRRFPPRMMRMANSPRRPPAGQPVDADPASAASQRLPAELRAWLHEVRWRRPEQPRHLVLILAAIFALHLVLLLALREAMRPPPFAPMFDTSPAVAVDLIETSPLPEPVAHKPSPPALAVDQGGRAATAPAPPRAAPFVREAVPAAQKQGNEAVIATPVAPKLFNSDGSLRLPQNHDRKDQFYFDTSAGSEMRLRGHNVIHCRPSNFAGGFAPHESVGAGFARKYLGFIGLYNPHTAAKTSERMADARAACDDLVR